jgi:hypothetical protein
MQEAFMSTQPFAARKPGPNDIREEQLETERTAAMTRMHPAEVGIQAGDTESQAIQDRREELAALGSGFTEDLTDYQVRINSIESSLDGGVTTFEGEVQVEEYLNNEFLCRVVVTLSVLGKETTPIGEVESQLLQATLERLRSLCSLTPEKMQASLTRTRRDEDVAYPQNDPFLS